MHVRSFASEIVVPTVKEALADRGSRRRVYIASIVTTALLITLRLRSASTRAKCVKAFVRSARQHSKWFKEFVTAPSTRVASEPSGLSPVLIVTCLHLHSMCQAPAGGKVDGTFLA